MKIKKISTKTPDNSKVLNQQSSSTTDTYSCNYTNNLVNTSMSSVLPIGSITEYAGSTAPEGWLLCNGQAVSRTTYANLFSIIGTTFGTGDGSTTFNLPDKRGRVGVGLHSSNTSFNTLGKTGGEETHTLTTGEMPTHNHTFTGEAHSHGLNSHTHSVGAHSHGLNSHTHTYDKSATSTGAASGNTGAASGNTGSTTLTIDQIPAHNHTVKGWADVTDGSGDYRVAGAIGPSANYGTRDTGGGKGHTHSLNNHTHSLNNHTHTITLTSTNSGKASGSTANSTAFDTGAATGNTAEATQGGTIGNAGSGNAHNNLQPYITLNYIIKAI